MKAKLFILSLLISCSLSAQEIKTVPMTLDDFLPFLEMTGYSFHHFNLSALAEPTLKVRLICQTWENQELVSEESLFSFSGKKELTIAVVPSQQDTLGRLVFVVPGGMQSAMNYPRKPLFFPSDPETPVYMYGTRPFMPGTPDLQEPGFIPILLYGSGWVDRRYGIIRFCGEKEIDPQLTGTMLKYLPHYYIFGLRYEYK